MQTTRRLMILGAATLAGASQAAQSRPEPPTQTRPAAQPSSFHDLLAAGRCALASSERED